MLLPPFSPAPPISHSRPARPSWSMAADPFEGSVMREPRDKIFITCAVTGNLTTPEQTPHLPITPEQIADACLGAAEAGAAIVHIHVREPGSGKPSMELGYYREVVERITVLCPEICTIDLNTMNSGKEVVINTPGNVRRMAKVMRDAGVKPEIELFDSGDIALMHDLLKDGTLEGPALCSFVMGVRYGFQANLETVLYARNLLPADAEFTAIGIGKAAFTAVAQSYLAGGHVRVGLEDTVYLSRGQLASSNAALVEKARRIVEDLGGQIATPREAREIIGLPIRLADASRVA